MSACGLCPKVAAMSSRQLLPSVSHPSSEEVTSFFLIEKPWESPPTTSTQVTPTPCGEEAHRGSPRGRHSSGSHFSKYEPVGVGVQGMQALGEAASSCPLLMETQL